MCKCKGKCGCNITQITKGEKGDNANPYSAWRGLLTQTSTNAPTATVNQNEIGGNIVWTYSSAGTYIGTLSGAFLQAKTHLYIQQISGQTVHVARTSDNTIQVTTVSNGVLNYTSLQILIFP